MRTDRAILEDKKVVILDDLGKWAEWYDKANRLVACTKIDDNVSVSTIFLGVNHSWDDNTFIWFETMVLGGRWDTECRRYETWEEAEKGHTEMIDLVTRTKGVCDKLNNLEKNIGLTGAHLAHLSLIDLKELESALGEVVNRSQEIVFALNLIRRSKKGLSKNDWPQNSKGIGKL